VGPRETLIFEDSKPGLEAAQRAGARVIEAQWWN
jgi:beta-phosphoglucomutase-like phosphatase (HAD superfamily)